MPFLGERLKRLREQKNINQEDLAAALNFSSKSTISQWEKGKSCPDIKTIETLCGLLGTSSDYLLGLTSFSNPSLCNLELPEEIKNEKLKDISILKHLNFLEMTLQEMLDSILLVLINQGSKEKGDRL